MEQVGIMFGILGTIIFGLIVGVIAKMMMPGKDPGGIIITILLGIAGSVLGRWVGQMLGFYGEADAAGFLMSLVGAVLLLMLVEMLNSAVEVLVDRISTERHPLSGYAKDLGSAAVFFALLLLFSTWALVLWDRLS